MAQTSLTVLQEADRVMTICNSCRYCEGYCAVFPAMERRLTFTAADLNYLANLCHNCGECFYACQYAPPHEFAVNVPRVFAELRRASYAQFAVPRAMGAAFDNGAVVMAAVRMASLLAAMGLGIAFFGVDGLLLTPAGTRFYDLVPHPVMAGLFSVVGLGVAVALIAGARKFWRSLGERPPGLGELVEAFGDAARLEYLRSGGAGCTYPDEHHSDARRWFHHATFYGFLLCFASTTVAAIYHFVFGWEAPYPILSLPVVLGTLGGIGLLAGPAGLLILKNHQDPRTAVAPQRGAELSFIALLFWTSATGLLLLALRSTPLMGLMLMLHLAMVFALFVTMPYGKFVHGIYRTAALVRYAIERKARPTVNAGG